MGYMDYRGFWHRTPGMWDCVVVVLIVVLIWAALPLFAVPCEDVKRYKVECTGSDTTMYTETVGGELFVCCYEGVLLSQEPTNEGCQLECEDPPPPPTGCCLSSGECQIVNGVLSGTMSHELDTRGCVLPTDIDVVITDETWNYDAPLVINDLSCFGTSNLEPDAPGSDKDIDLHQLVMNNCTLLGVNATLEFHSGAGELDILVGTGAANVNVNRVEHEGLSGTPRKLAPANFDGVAIYDVTGAYSGTAREWDLEGDVSVGNGTTDLISLEKKVVINLGTFKMTSSGKIRIGDTATITGQAGAELVAGTGATVVNVSAGTAVILTKSADDPIEDKKYLWQ